MGRERHWSSSSGGGRGGGKFTTTSSTTTRRAVQQQQKEKEITPGCMSGVLHLFDFNPITQHPCFKANPIQQQEDISIPIPTKGIEAPRNSLESETGLLKGTTQEEKFDIPAEIRLTLKGKDCCSSSENSNSPAAKTPNLVARLMGLDLLPDSSSASSSPSCASSNKVHSRQLIQSRMKKKRSHLLENDNSGTRSLPDTPRISSARRSDVDPRFSLQINRENDEFEHFGRVYKDQKSRKKDLKQEDQENWSPGHYARQMVKQVKESVSRRVGVDITNVVRKDTEIPLHIASKHRNINHNNNTTTRNKIIQVDHSSVRNNKPKPLAKIEEESSTIPKHSPRSRKLELKQKPTSILNDKILPPPKPILTRLPPPPPPKQPLPPPLPISVKPKSKPLPKEQKMEKCKKANCERFTPSQRREANPSKTGLDSPDKKCKKVQPAQAQTQVQTRPSKPCSRLSSCSNPSRTPYQQHQQRERTLRHLRDRDDTTTSTPNSTCEYRYIKEILACTGIKDSTLISFNNWFSPSHPLPPSLFLYLEQETSSSNLKNKKKMLFDLVDEILANILKPYFNLKPWFGGNNFIKQLNGKQLLEEVWSKITSFPSAKCEVLEDIDSLIEKDLPEDSANLRGVPMFEECESIVLEIEQDVLETLIIETTVSFLMLTSAQQRDRAVRWRAITAPNLDLTCTSHGYSRDEMPLSMSGPL